MTDNKWIDCDKDKPPGDDDWPIVVESFNGKCTIIEKVMTAHSWKSRGYIKTWKSLGIPTPPESDLPKLFLGGEEVELYQEHGYWFARRDDPDFEFFWRQGYPSEALAHIAVVELLQSFQVEGYMPHHQVPGPITSEDDELLPCRVCGGSAFIPEYQIQVSCPDCGIDVNALTFAEAKEKWNKLMGPSDAYHKALVEIADEKDKECDQLRESRDAIVRLNVQLTRQTEELEKKLANQAEQLASAEGVISYLDDYIGPGHSLSIIDYRTKFPKLDSAEGGE